MSVFEPIKIVARSSRASSVIAATKRSIDRLTIVAGPTSSGKSTFIKQLCQSAELRRSLSIPNSIDAETSANECAQLPTGTLGHVLFHYDTLRPLGRYRTYSRDPALTLLHASGSITVLTLRPPPEQLMRQFEGAGHGPSRRKLRLRQLYAEPGFLDRWYSIWFRQVAGFHGIRRHLVIENQCDGVCAVREVL